MRVHHADLEKINEFDGKIKKFEDRMKGFQIEIRTIEKLLREDITSMEKYKLDVVNFSPHFVVQRGSAEG